MSDPTWVSSDDYVGPGKWAEALRETGRIYLPPKGARKRPKARPQASEVQVTRVDPEALSVALSLAEGDASRLRFLPDGSVIVGNQSKRRNQEHP